MPLSRVRITTFRCLREVELGLSARRNYVFGPNGAGKTSLLEAVFVLGRGRSFRTRQMPRLVQHGSEGFTVYGEVDVDGAKVRVVAGEAFGKKGPVEGIVTAPRMLDVKLSKNRFEYAVPGSHNVFAYVFQNTAVLEHTEVNAEPGQIAIFGPGEVIRRTSEKGARMLLLSGQPIGEPVARRGPFVMNTEDELRQAIDDYLAGRLLKG